MNGEPATVVEWLRRAAGFRHELHGAGEARRGVHGKVRTMLFVLFGPVAMILLIACASRGPALTDVRMAQRTNPPGEIIGVVGDVKHGSLTDKALPMVYYPRAHLSFGFGTLVVAR